MSRRSPLPHASKGSSSQSADAEILPLPLAHMGDAELLAQLIEGRPAAFRELFDRFSGLVRGVLVRMLGADADLEDLIQETFLVVVRRPTMIREGAALRSFLYGVAVRIARNELRKRALRRWIPWEEVPHPPAAVATHDVVLREAIWHVYATLDRLSPDLRIAFVLRYVEGHELSEAAALCGTSLATFKRRLARATARFELLGERDPVLSQWLQERGGS